MSTARESAIRLLQLMMIASVVLPTALFAYASWVSYRDIQRGRRRAHLSLARRHAGAVAEGVRDGRSHLRGSQRDRARHVGRRRFTPTEPRLHQRLASIVATMPQLHAILLVGRDGRPLAASTLAAVPDSVNFSDRDYFQAQLERDAGTYVSDMRSPRLPGISAPISSISRAAWNRPTAPSTASSRWRCGRATSRISTG